MVNTIYVDSVNGLDSNDGSINAPYKTLQYVLSNKIPKSNVYHQIELAEGSYIISTSTSFSTFTSGKLLILGKGANTEIVQSIGLNSNALAGSRTFSLTIAKCKYNILTNLNSHNLNAPLYEWNFKNILFEYAPNNAYSVFYSGNMIQFDHCVKLTSSTSFLRTTEGSIRVTNSIGYFTSGYGTSEVKWNISGNTLNTIDNYKSILNSGEFSWVSSYSLIYDQGSYKTYVPEIPEMQPQPLFPIMTSNTTPSPYVASESSVYSTSYPASKAMDGILSNDNKWLASNNSYPQWIKIKLDKIKRAEKLSLSCANSIQTFYKWKLQGSNDDSLWYDLLSYDNDTPPINTYRDYDIINSGEYLYYRLYMEAGNGIPSISGFRLLDSGQPLINGYWKTLKSEYLTSSDFLAEGITDINKITIITSNGTTPISALSNKFKILSYFTQDRYSSDIKLKAKPLNTNQLVYSSGDVSLVGVESIDSINLTASSDSKVTISFDSGLTEHAYLNGVWENVVDASFGMTPSEINSLTPLIVKELRGDSNTIRFNYYLTENSYIDKIQMTVSMQGYEKLADTKDYSLSYNQSARKLIYNITKSGTYSVNYVDGSA